jgi:Ca2+:H+ antiporter
MRLRRTRPSVSIPALHGHCDVVGRVAPASIGEILVGAAEEAGQSLGRSQMGVLALVGGAAESGSAIAMGPAS